MTTISDIAAKAGVTASTVSNVLNGRYVAKRSDAARRALKIRRLAKEMGYRPHIAARATRTGRTGCIGMLASAKATYSVTFGGFEQALVQALEERGLLLVKGLLTHDMLQADGRLPRIIAESLADGLILNYAFHIPPGITDMVERHGLPAVWINSKQPHNCVHPDDAAATHQATRYLLERGHTRIAYVDTGWMENPADYHYSIADRRLGYERAMCEAGLTPRVIDARLLGPVVEPVGRVLRRCMRALEQRGDATAVIYNNTGETMLLAAAQLGIRVPDDLSLISIDIETDAVSRVAITRLVVPFPAVAQMAVEMLCRMLDHGEASRPPRAIPYEVTEGQTVRALNV